MCNCTGFACHYIRSRIGGVSYEAMRKRGGWGSTTPLIYLVGSERGTVEVQSKPYEIGGMLRVDISLHIDLSLLKAVV
jgi:hypothetical protein